MHRVDRPPMMVSSPNYYFRRTLVLGTATLVGLGALLVRDVATSHEETICTVTEGSDSPWNTE